MKNLENILKMGLLKIPSFTMDNFQDQILKNLYLEFFFQNCRFLITPEFRYLTTGEAGEDEEFLLQSILEERQDLLGKFKHYIIHNLSLYSALLETNSYYIGLNDHLLISRFVPVAEQESYFEVKLYTNSKQDLKEHYKDKIYIGRDFISMKTLKRDHFGLKFIRNSLSDQITKLTARIEKFAPEEVCEEMEHEYLDEIEELTGEFAESATEIMEAFPVEINSNTLEARALIDVNIKVRDLRHILIEIEDSVREMEQRLLDLNASRAARYATKFRKDITNDINYLMIKVNGRISDTINGIHL